MYKLLRNSRIVRIKDNAAIPKDNNNSDYTHYLSWLSDGNIPAQVEELTPMQLWEQEIAAESMSDTVEYLWDAIGINKAPKSVKDAYTKKKSKRAAKP